ncbi:MAG: SH3 domain-containing protein [Sporocytophaga sp.]|uniref:SH3 domain-containing protein n=1 Tax=Sporocytophaga sp. TaxID=2231183 RepID=UPI001B21580B|nr:SH3 domain-containing protein [Sporocytophaga sp.]MBO9702255.1 SH3 domain-containing protein [Sporocytophaga sp.]
MRILYRKTFIILIILFFHSSIYGQLYSRNDRKVVYSGEANVRESPSPNAKIIATLKQGTEVIICSKTYKIDTISGVIAYWMPILYNGTSGYIWGINLAINTFGHINGNRLLVKNDSKGLAYKIFAGDSLIISGTYPDKPYNLYSHIYPIQPLSSEKNNLYFKLSDSDLMYSFDGVKVNKAGRCDKENINANHLSSRKELKDSLGSIINRDKVNLRVLPSVSSKTIGQLSKYTLVEQIEKLAKLDTVNKEENYWFKIKWKGKVGYVWGSSISSPKQQIQDNDDENTSYLLCHNALFVLNKGSIVNHVMLNYDIYDETLHSFGDLGFGQGNDFVAIESIAHGCGEWGGDVYYLWNGKELKLFCSDGGVGDGPLSEGVEHIFPSYQHGIPGKVIKHSYSSEMIDIMPADDCEQNYVDALDYYLISIMSYNGDKLVEVPSKHLDLKKIIEREFPKYKLIQYKFGDINKDNIEDVVFQARMDRTKKDSDGYDQYIYKTKIGVALGTSKDSLQLFKVNDHFIGDDEPRVSILLDDSGILITSYSAFKNGEWRQSIYGRKSYHFVYNPTDQKIYWDSVSTIFDKGPQKLTFKSKKVLFENTWKFTEYENEEY